MDTTNLAKINEENQKRQREDKMHAQKMQQASSLERTLFESFQSVVKVLEGDKTKAEAIGLIVNALDKLEGETSDNKTRVEVVKAGLDELKKQISSVPVDSLKQIPKFLQQKDSVKVTNIDEFVKAVNRVEEVIKRQKLSVEAPVVNVPEAVVNVPAPIVNVDAPDMTAIESGMSRVEKAVKDSKISGSIETKQQNTLITEPFDEYKLEYDSFDDGDDPRVDAITYLNKGKKVAKITYKYDSKGNLVGAKRS